MTNIKKGIRHAPSVLNCPFALPKIFINCDWLISVHFIRNCTANTIFRLVKSRKLHFKEISFLNEGSKSGNLKPSLTHDLQNNAKFKTGSIGGFWDLGEYVQELGEATGIW